MSKESNWGLEDLELGTGTTRKHRIADGVNGWRGRYEAMEMGRRQFLKLGAVVAGKAALVAGGCDVAGRGKGHVREDEAGVLPKQTLGKTGRDVSIIGLGGMTVIGMEQEPVNKLVADSLEKGVTYFDVAPTYGDAELTYGVALKGKRDKVFLACKTTKRDKAGAREELENSLKRLQTDHVDLYQFHAINDVAKDVEVMLGKDGAVETFLEARREGKIRHIGFSAHSKAAALAAMREFDFDTIMYPVNFVCDYEADFVNEVVAEAQKRGVGIVCIKSMAARRWEDGENHDRYPNCWYRPIEEPGLAVKALGYSYGQGATVIMPPGNERLYRLAVDLARDGLGMKQGQLKDLESVAREYKPIFPG